MVSVDIMPYFMYEYLYCFDQLYVLKGHTQFIFLLWMEPDGMFQKYADPGP